MAVVLSPEKLLLARPLLRRIRAKRKARKMSTFHAADRVDCNHTTYKNFETGSFRALRAEKIVFLVRVLGLDEVDAFRTLAAVDERLVIDTTTPARIKTAALLASVWERMNAKQMASLRELLVSIREKCPQPPAKQFRGARINTEALKTKKKLMPRLKGAA